MKHSYDLNHFLEAQENAYNQALLEIKSGRKMTHWIWFIFPQFKGLGRSSTAARYAIKSKEEAIAYFHHPILGIRLKEITNAVLDIPHKTAHEILGSPDDLKLKSSMTLFNEVQSETDIFQQVLDKYYNGNKCKSTLNQL